LLDEFKRKNGIDLLKIPSFLSINEKKLIAECIMNKINEKYNLISEDVDVYGDGIKFYKMK